MCNFGHFYCMDRICLHIPLVNCITSSTFITSTGSVCCIYLLINFNFCWFFAHLDSHVLKLLSSLWNNVFEAEYWAVKVCFVIEFTVLQVWGLDLWWNVPPEGGNKTNTWYNDAQWNILHTSCWLEPIHDSLVDVELWVYYAVFDQHSEVFCYREHCGSEREARQEWSIL